MEGGESMKMTNIASRRLLTHRGPALGWFAGRKEAGIKEEVRNFTTACQILSLSKPKNSIQFLKSSSFFVCVL